MTDASPRRRRIVVGDLEAGDELDGRYRIVRCLGSGGMGAVYEAEQIKLRRRVAIKLMHPERAVRDTSTKRFSREARTASAIEHRNVVDILDFGELEDGTTYLVMELLRGTDLASRLKEGGPLSWPQARGILVQVLRGLKAVHDNKIIHRDIKPANIFLLDPDDEYAEEDRVKVLDFGIARFEVGEETQELTGTAEMLGTVTYMAPELGLKKPATVQSDVYAVGILAYKMLTGMTPFGGGTAVQVLYSHVHEPVPSPRELEPSIPEAVEAAIIRALAKDPAERFQTADEFGRALVSIDDEGKISSREMSEVLRTPSFPPLGSSSAVLKVPASESVTGGDAGARGRLRAGLVGLGVLGVLGVVAWIGLGSEEPAGEAVGPVVAVVETGEGSSSVAVDEPGGTTTGATTATASTGEGASTDDTDAGSETGGGTTGEFVGSSTGDGAGDEEPLVSVRSGRRPTRGGRKGKRKSKPRSESAEPAPKPANEAPLPDALSKKDMGPGLGEAKKAAKRCGRELKTAINKATVRVKVGADGRVESVVIPPPVQGTDEAACIRKAIERLRFPKSRTGGEATWTLAMY